MLSPTKEIANGTQPMNLSATSNVASIASRLTEGNKERDALRTDGKRRDHLRRVGSILSGADLHLHLSGVNTASVNMEDPDLYTVHIARHAFDQDVTNYDGVAYDLIMQEALLVHEMGHILYTDHPAFKWEMDQLPKSQQAAFKSFWNGLEDGAIEELLRHEFNVADGLEVLNANLFARSKANFETKAEATGLTFMEAVEAATIDLAVYDTGCTRYALNTPDVWGTTADYDRFKEEAIPILRETAETVLRTPNGEKRTMEIARAFKAIMEIADEADASGMDRAGDGDEPGSAKPGDADEDTGTPNADATDALEDLLEELASEGAEGADGDGADEDDEGAMDGSPSATETPEGAQVRLQLNADGEPAGSAPKPATDADLEERYNAEATSPDPKDATDQESLMEELEEMAEAIGEGTPVDFIDEDRTGDATIRAEGDRIARRLEQVLSDRLRQESRNRTVRNRATGRLDTKSMRRWERGDYRIFNQERKGNKKDYNALLILDRSGSMEHEVSTDKITPAASATYGFAKALEAIGVNVCVMDFLWSTVRLVKPFGMSVSDRAGAITSFNTGGKTPLDEAVRVGRRRLNKMGGNTFAIVVTDGYAGDKAAFAEELEKCNFPVLGVYVAMEYDSLSDISDANMRTMEMALEHYHRHTIVTDEGDLMAALRTLSRGVMF